jgi:hypothetical protein
VLVAVLGNSITDDNARIANGPCNGQDFEVSLGKITEIVEIVHFVFGKKKSVLGIVGRGGGTDDHAGGVRAISSNAVRRAGVATECSEIGDGKCGLAADSNKRADENNCSCKTDSSLHVHGRVSVADNLRLAKSGFADKHK